MTSRLAEAALFVSGAAGPSILLKATIFLALGLTAAWLARRARASVRHLLLAATFATLLALPFVVLLGPAVSIEIPVAAGRDTVAAAGTAVPGRSAATPAAAGTKTVPSGSGVSLPSWSTLALGLWFGGTVLLTMSLVFDLWRVRRIVRHGLPWVELRRKAGLLATDGGVSRTVDVLRHEEAVAPFTCGVWRPVIVLPTAATAWSAADVDRALAHELEHVRRRDWIVQVAARVACACYWCHPLVWVAWRRLCLEAERACDDVVVQQAESTEYAEQLVSLARRMSTANAQPVPGMANRTDLAHRVAAILDATQRRGRAGAVAVAGAISAACVVGTAIAPVRAIGVLPRGDAAIERTASRQTRNTAGPRPARPGLLDTALYEAASQGDVGAIATLLDAGANVDAAILGDGSPLIGAARKGHLDAVRLLLDRGATLDMAVPGDGSPLIVAAGDGHLDIVTLLLDRGANIEQVVPGDENALIHASGSGHLEVVRLLVSRGADVNARVWAPRGRGDGEWRTALSVARRNGREPVVTFLQSAGAVE